MPLIGKNLRYPVPAIPRPVHPAVQAAAAHAAAGSKVVRDPALVPRIQGGAPAPIVQGTPGRGGAYAGPLHPVVAAARAVANHPAVVAAAAQKAKAAKTRAAASNPSNMLQQILNRYISSLQTPAQERAQINANVSGQINQELAGYKEIYDQTKRDQVQQAQRAQGFALALNSMAPQMQAQTQADYTQAARGIQGLGTGLTGAVADEQQAAANQAAAQVASLTGGLGQTGGYDVPGLRNIAQFTGVVQPSADLYREAASQAAAAGLRTRAGAGAVENIAQGYLQDQSKTRQDYLAHVADVLAKRPGLVAQLQTAGGGSNRQDMATIIQGLGLVNQQANTASLAQDRTFQQGIDQMNQYYKGIETYYKGLDENIKGFLAKSTATKNERTGKAAVTTAQTGKVKAYGTDEKGNILPTFYPIPNSNGAIGKIPTGFRRDDSSPTGLREVVTTTAKTGKESAATAKAQAYGRDAKGNILPKYYPIPGSGGKAVGLVPKGFIRDDSNKVTGLRQLAPPPATETQKTTAATGQQAAATTAAKVYGRDEKGNILPDFYPNPDADGQPTPVPDGYVRDDAQPHGIRFVGGPSGPKGSSSTTKKNRGPSPTTIANTLRGSYGTASKAALKPPYTTVGNQAAVTYAGAAPTYKPSMPLAKARDQILRSFYGAYAKNPSAVAAVTALLQGLGFK